MYPKTYKKLIASRFSKNFRAAVEVVAVDWISPGSNEVVIRNLFAGVNASDVNITAGVSFVNTPPPFALGVEAAGEVVAVGSNVKHLEVGDHVITAVLGGGYCEYLTIDASLAIPVALATPEVMTIVVSGLTAAIGLEVVGEIKTGEVVLVTAAAGGTGHCTVQLAKQAGAHVIGTCRSQAKVKFLQQLGCDRAINYCKENLAQVLKTEYPQGVDLVYECVGRELFDICVENLAVRGRLVSVGYISEYTSELESVSSSRIYSKLLWKSASIRGFLFSHYAEHIQSHTSRLMELFTVGKFRPTVDSTEFKGIESVVDAVEYLHSGSNCGKVVVSF